MLENGRRATQPQSPIVSGPRPLGGTNLDWARRHRRHRRLALGAPSGPVTLSGAQIGEPNHLSARAIVCVGPRAHTHQKVIVRRWWCAGAAPERQWAWRPARSRRAASERYDHYYYLDPMVARKLRRPSLRWAPAADRQRAQSRGAPARTLPLGARLLAGGAPRPAGRGPRARQRAPPTPAGPRARPKHIVHPKQVGRR